MNTPSNQPGWDFGQAVLGFFGLCIGECAVTDSRKNTDGSGEDDGHEDDAGGESIDGSDNGYEERGEERVKAATAFDKVDSAANGWVQEGQFEALMEAVGTTYSVESHKPKLILICGLDGRLQREAFLSWYDEWLFGGDDSSGDEEDEERQVVSSDESSAEKRKDGFASLVKQVDGWKCQECLVSNPESSMKCLSCEIARPEEDSKEGSGSGEGILGESRRGSSATAAALPVAVPSSVTTSAADGSLGSAQATSPPATAAPVPGAGTNASEGSTFGSPAAATPAESAASMGEDVEFDSLASSSGGGGGGDSNNSGDEEGCREERGKAETAFDKVDSGGDGWIEESQFEALMEAYSVEDHKPKLISICGSDGKLQREAFLSWCDESLLGESLLVGDDFSVDEDAEEGQVSGGTGSARHGKDGFADLVKSQADGWRCQDCLVSNPDSSLKCLSCEIANPGEENKAGRRSGAGILGGSSG